MNRLSCRPCGFSPVAGLLLAVVLLAAAPLSGANEAETPAQARKKEVQGYRLAPEKTQKAVVFNRARDWLYFLGSAYGVLVYFLVLCWRVGPRYRNWAERVARRRLVQALVYVPLLLLTLSVLNLPRPIYAHWLVHRFGLSVQGWRSWVWDWSKGQLVGWVFAAAVAWILYGVIRRSPRRWWFYFWLSALPMIVFVVFLEPLVIDPLFYKFEPLAAREPALVAEIEKVTQRAGLAIPRERMFEMKASEKLRSVNAYVTGVGASKRVVVWDTTLRELTTPQILSVFGHEMGHYVLGHIPKGMAVFAAALLVLLYLGHRAMGWVLGRWGQRWGIRGLDDWAALPALLLFFSFANFLAAPLDHAYSRHLEHQADVYALEVTHGIVPDAGEVAAQAHQILGEIDLEEPDPPRFIVIWLYTHPPINERIVFARTYDPWSRGQAPQFVK